MGFFFIVVSTPPLDLRPFSSFCIFLKRFNTEAPLNRPVHFCRSSASTSTSSIASSLVPPTVQWESICAVPRFPALWPQALPCSNVGYPASTSNTYTRWALSRLCQPSLQSLYAHPSTLVIPCYAMPSYLISSSRPGRQTSNLPATIRPLPHTDRCRRRDP